MKYDTYAENPIILEFKEVEFSYLNQKVIDCLSWSIRSGEFQTIIGRSGTGKSTFLDLASGLTPSQAGVIEYHGQKVVGPISEIGFVFQQPTLLDWMSVSENILLPIKIKRHLSKLDILKLNELLKVLGIEKLINSFPWQLSGGQQSRVSIARALINSPQILMMDEPFASLDAITRDELQELLLNICRTHNIAVIFVTHDVQEAVFLSDRVCLMASGCFVECFQIDLPQIRLPEIRFDSDFNEQTSRIKMALLSKVKPTHEL
jgi:NitT/TauT family transport system ATP-binding protein